MEKQNITLSIPQDLLRKARMIAVHQGVSLSGLLVETLRDRVARQQKFQRAGTRQKALMRRGLKLGTRGKAGWKRDELHAR